LTFLELNLASTMVLIKNRKISRYTILEDLSHRASGTVFRVDDPVNERDVVLRVFDANLPQQQKADFLLRFFEEARVLVKLHHPNIASMLDVGESNDSCFVVTEYVVGRSVEMLLGDCPVSAEQAIDIAIQAAAGLAYAHAHGIIHGGLKPSKLLLGDDGIVRITDFSVASLTETSISRIGLILYSARFVAPEQIKGQNTDARTDLYALGTILYEMATGQPAFGRKGGRIHEMMKEIVADPPDRPSMIKPGLPAGLETIICRLLEKTPEERYQSAEQLIADLRGLAPLPIIRIPASRAAALTSPSPLAASTATPYRHHGGTSSTGAVPQSNVSIDFETKLIADIELFKQHGDEILARAKASVPEALEVSEMSMRAAFTFPTICPEQLESQSSEPLQAAALPTGTLLAEMTNATRSQQNKEKHPKPLDYVDADTLSVRMRQLFDYLKDLTSNLNVVKPANSHVYHLLSVGEFTDLAWGHGMVHSQPYNSDIGARIDRITLNYTLTAPHSFEVKSDNISAESLRNKLKAAQAVYQEQAIAGKRGTTRESLFRIAGTIKLSADFFCDYKTGLVQLNLLNIERFGLERYRIAPENLKLEFCEEFARHILGQSNCLTDFLSRQI
jgi:serine/threonine protein kinase